MVGIALSHVQWLDAFGALVLFLTNFFAILLAGGAVFWLSGVRPRPMGAAEAHIHRRALAGAVLGMVVVALVLGFNGYHTLTVDRDSNLAEQTVEAWLDGTRYSVAGVTLTFPPQDFLVRGPASARVVIAGTGTVPPIERLGADLEAALGYPVSVECAWSLGNPGSLSGSAAAADGHRDEPGGDGPVVGRPWGLPADDPSAANPGPRPPVAPHGRQALC